MMLATQLFAQIVEIKKFSLFVGLRGLVVVGCFEIIIFLLFRVVAAFA